MTASTGEHPSTSHVRADSPLLELLALTGGTGADVVRAVGS